MSSGIHVLEARVKNRGNMYGEIVWEVICTERWVFIEYIQRVGAKS